MKDDREWWVTCPRFTAWVQTEGQHGTKIKDCAPILNKWKGQNFYRMVAYYNADVVNLEQKEDV